MSRSAGKACDTVGVTEHKFLEDSYVERTDEETRAHYEAWAHTYDQELQENGYSTPANAMKALELFELDRDAEILDVGCGTGLFGRQLWDAGFMTIDGCDYSPAMLDQARETGMYRRLFEANLNQPPMRVNGFPVAGNRYGAAAVVGAFSFGHVEAAALDEVARVVEPGGAIVIGLNDTFWMEGSLNARIDDMIAEGTIEKVDVQPGDHLPGTGLSGWFISLRVK